jgi:hypothetical protein
LASSSIRDDSNAPSTFIIAPPNISIASNIHDLLQAGHSTRRESTPLQLLNTVQIMQYFDVAGLAESISEVSSYLHDLNNRSETLPTSYGKDPWRIKRQILLLDGLCPALESTQRRSGLVQANALAASLVRSVTVLSRSYPSLLVLFTLEASRDMRSGAELTSAFSSPGNSICGISPCGMLGRTLLAGIDTVILLHDMVDAGLNDGDLIVEVVKDRVGANLGQWVVWANSG